MPDGTRNLRPVQSKEEAIERGRKGGIASGVSRRNKKRFKELAILFGQLPASSKQKATLDQLGVEKKDQDVNAVIMARLIQKAIQGDTQAIKLYSDLNSEAFDIRTEQELPTDPLTKSLYEEAEKMMNDDKQ